MNRRLLLIIAALFLLAWLPRVFGLDRFVTPDERKWLARSANFYQAVNQGDWVHTFQREHPGVTVMWAGTLGFLQRFPSYAQDAPGQFTWELEHIEAWLLQYSAHTPLEMLVAGRWWVVLAISLTLALSYLPLNHLLGEKMALLALLFVVWDPFHIALSRQLHPDGLAASLSFLAFITFVAWLYGGRARRYLLFSGVVMGLAWLTKSPTILLVPIVGLLVVVEWVRQSRPPLTPSNTAARKRAVGGTNNSPSPTIGRAGWGARVDRSDNQGTSFSAFISLSRPYFIGLVTWGLLSLLVFVVCWPAMWVDPLGTLGKMATETSDMVEGHVNVNYFLGQPTSDPGVIFYPIAYLFRTTPMVLIGLISLLLLAWQQRSPFDLNVRRIRHVSGALLLFALIFTLIITVGAKKFDRYLLPVFLPLDVLAALGWVGLAQMMASKAQKQVSITRWARTTMAPHGAPWGGLLLLLLALPALLTYPYYLTYYNPLLGGSFTAPNVLFVGWGEGLDEAAAWLNQQPDAEQLRVATWYADGPFSYFFRGKSGVLNNLSPLGWLDSDFMILYVNQWQREKPSPEALTWFAEREPAHVVSANGLELARVYNVREAPLPDFLDWSDKRRADFGEKISLVGYRLEKTEVQPGEVFQVTLYEGSLAPMEIDYNVLVRLLAADGSELWRDEGWPWGTPTTNWPVGTHRPDGHTIVIPDDAKAGLYALTLSFYDPATFDSLVVNDSKSENESENEANSGPTEQVIDFIRVGMEPTVERAMDPIPQFGSVAQLKGVTLPEQVAQGEPLSMQLLWQSVEHTPQDYTVFVHVVAPDGTLAAQQDRPPLNGFAATHLWDPGELFFDAYSLPLAPDIAPGEYEVRIGLYTVENGRLPVTLAGNQNQTSDFVTVGRVLITE